MPAAAAHLVYAQLRQLLGSAAQGQSCFLILDAARGIDVRALGREHQAEGVSLYSGPDGDRLADVAPYLFAVSPESSLLKWFAARWGEHLGVIVRSTAGRDGLREHLRQFVMATDPEGRAAYLFRFYDPRVLRAFLSGCEPPEAKRVFGPIGAWFAESATGDRICVYSMGRDGVTVVEHPA